MRASRLRSLRGLGQVRGAHRGGPKRLAAGLRRTLRRFRGARIPIRSSSRENLRSDASADRVQKLGNRVATPLEFWTCHSRARAQLRTRNPQIPVLKVLEFGIRKFGIDGSGRPAAVLGSRPGQALGWRKARTHAGGSGMMILPVNSTLTLPVDAEAVAKVSLECIRLPDGHRCRRSSEQSR